LVGDGMGVFTGVLVGVEVFVGVLDGDGVLVGVAVLIGVGVLDGDGVFVGVGVGVLTGVLVGVAVLIGVGVLDGDGVFVGVGVGPGGRLSPKGPATTRAKGWVAVGTLKALMLTWYSPRGGVSIMTPSTLFSRSPVITSLP
jgi:hypothetical protein